MISIYLIKFLCLLIIPYLIYGKSTISEEDPKTDYVFHDEVSGDVSNTTTAESTTLKAAGIEVEGSLESTTISTSEQLENNSTIEAPNLVETVTKDQNSISFSCPSDSEELRAKVSDIMVRHLPTLLKLKPIKRGGGTRLVLENGKLSMNNDFKIIGQPLCNQMEEQTKKYNFMVSFENLIGFYDWKIYNLFRNNYSESAIISIKQLKVEFVFVEDIKEKTLLKEVKMGSIDGLDVKVNIPENITNIRVLKQMMAYLISRISTMIANRSKESITSNMEQILAEAIIEKTSIKP